MKLRKTGWQLAIGLATVMGGFVLGANSALAVVNAGNAFYTVHVQDSGSGIGKYTITTGAQHPAGSGLNVLFGGGFPGTSFNSLHSYSTGTDYTQNNNYGGTAAISTLGGTGYRTVYTLSGPPATPDALIITQDIGVNGSNFSNSTVQVTTKVQNTGSQPVSIGVRYLWDVQVGSDDGPTFQQLAPNGLTRLTEGEFFGPAFTAFKIEDNDINANPPTFNVLGTVLGPSSVVPTPTPPTRLVYAGWPSSVGTLFSYSINPNLDVASAGNTVNDSAVLYYWGDNQANALVIPAGGSVQVSSSLFLTPPGFSLGSNTIQELGCTVDVPVPQPVHALCITRPARFWMTHPIGTAENCASLLDAFEALGGGINLGFICLPTTYRNSDAVANAEDAVIEALGFYWRSANVTGEPSGTQGAKLRGSRLCQARKKLAVEFIAAQANVAMLGTDPSNCSHTSSGLTTSIPSNILQQAEFAIQSDDLDAIRVMTANLRLFNGLGQTNQLPANLLECSGLPTKELRNVSRDPTQQLTCPGINNRCETAELVTSFPYKRSIKMSDYTFTSFTPACAQGGGGQAFWKIAPPVSAAGRHFVIQTGGSSFTPIVSVWQGGCSNAVQVACSTSTNYDPTPETVLQFTTDGTNTYYIAVQGLNAAIGTLKLKVTSF